MFRGKIHFGVILMALTANNSVGLAACSAQQKTNRPKVVKERRTENSPGRTDETAMMQIKTLNEGAYSSVKDAFLAVARDQQTYQTLRAAVKEIPEVEPDFFQRSALVAIFLGSRRTGGYGVAVEAKAGALEIRETTPPRGMMTTQALTSPYKIVAVPVDDKQPLAVAADQAWRASARPYKVTAGELNITGGIAGRAVKNALAGQLGVLRHGQLATFLFQLKGGGENKTRRSEEVVTGTVQDDGRVTIEGLTGGGLLDPPHGAVSATGQFTENEGKLSLTLKTAATSTPDGFNAEANLQAVATGPPPQKAKSRPGEEEPM